MQPEQIFDILNNNPTFHLATVDGDQPRVRGMLLYKADKSGIVFHTGPFKDLYRQIQKNPKVEMCFFDNANGVQVRVRGKLELVEDDKLKEEIVNHPSRAFLQGMKAGKTQEEFFKIVSVFRLKNGKANIWTFETNFGPKEDIDL